MNRMLFVIFENEARAAEGVHALRQLHADGELSLYALAVVARQRDERLVVLEHAGQRTHAAGLGMAVGALVGLLGGPMGVVLGATAGSAIGAVTDFWIAGVGLDFVQLAADQLKPGKVAVVCDVEEDWVLPVDARMEALGGTVLRRARSDMAHAQFDRDLEALRAEVAEREAEYAHATGAAKQAIVSKLEAARASLSASVERARHKVAELEHAGMSRINALEMQVAEATGNAKRVLEQRIETVRFAYSTRSGRLGDAWGLAKEAFKA